MARLEAIQRSSLAGRGGRRCRVIVLVKAYSVDIILHSLAAAVLVKANFKMLFVQLACTELKE